MNQVLASLSAEAAEVREYVDQLDAVRAKCAAAGEYRQAQASVDRMQQVNTRFAELVVGQACRLNDGEARRLRDAHALAALEAKKAWRESVAAFDLETAETLLRLERQQMLEIQDADAALCAPTLSSRSNGIHNSSASSRRGSSAADGEDPLLAPMAEVKALREALRRLAAQQRYLEADSAQRDLAVAEARLRALNHRQREARRGQRLRDVAARLHAQRAGAEERVYRGLQALLRSRDLELAALLERQRQDEQRLAAATAMARSTVARVLARCSASSSGPLFIDTLMATGRPLLHVDEYLS